MIKYFKYKVLGLTYLESFQKLVLSLLMVLLLLRKRSMYRNSKKPESRCDGLPLYHPATHQHQHPVLVPVLFPWPVPSGVVSLPFSPSTRPIDPSMMRKNPTAKPKIIAKMIFLFIMEVFPIRKRPVHCTI